MAPDTTSRLERQLDEMRRAQAEQTSAMQSALERLITAVSELAALKEDHERHSQELVFLRKRMHDFATDITRIGVLENEIANQRRDVDGSHRRLERIERALPNMELASGWVFKFALGILGLLGMVAFGVIIWAVAQGAHP